MEQPDWKNINDPYEHCDVCAYKRAGECKVYDMSLCHAAYFCKDWEKTRDCKLEHEAAVAYGLEIIYE